MEEVPPPENVGSENWKPLIMFTDQSPSFAYGAEFGMIYEQLRAKTFEPKAAAAHFKQTAVFHPTEVEGWLLMEVTPFKLSAV